VDESFKRKVLPAEIVALAVGLISDQELYKKLNGEVVQLFLVGDGGGPKHHERGLGCYEWQEQSSGSQNAWRIAQSVKTRKWWVRKFPPCAMRFALCGFGWGG